MYRNKPNSKKKFIGGLVGQGSTKLLSSLGVNESTANMIGSGIGATTGFLTGDIVGGITESGRFASSAINEFSNDPNTKEVGNLIGSASQLGASFIKPTPMAEGGPIKQKPTQADSLALYNNAILKNKFYGNNPDYRLDKSETDFQNKEVRNMLIEQANSDLDIPINDYQIKTLLETASIKGKPFTKSEEEILNKTKGQKRFGPVSGTNLTSFGDILYDGVDNYFNPFAPPIYLHPNISPQGSQNYTSERIGDSSDVPYYDPIAVKPGKLLNSIEVVERIKKYGTQGIPKSKIDNYKQELEKDYNTYLKPSDLNNTNETKDFTDYSEFKKALSLYEFYKDNTDKPIAKPVFKKDDKVVAKQQQLIDAGFDIGSADGIWGKKSQAAWEELQNKQNTKIEEPKIEKEEVLKQEVKNKPSLNEGEYRVPTNFPNVQIIRNKEKPLFYENANGDRVPFSNKFDGNFDTNFQYNKQMAMGGEMNNNTSDEFLNFTNALASNRGNTSENLMKFAETVGMHESGYTFDPKQKEKGGSSLGIYQWQAQRVPDTITRAKTSYKKLGLEVPAFITELDNKVKQLKKEGKPVNEAIMDLDKYQQSILFLADMAEHQKTKIKDLKPENFKQQWGDAWWAGEEKDREKRFSKFDSSMQHIEKEKLSAFSDLTPKEQGELDLIKEMEAIDLKNELMQQARKPLPSSTINNELKFDTLPAPNFQRADEMVAPIRDTSLINAENLKRETNLLSKPNRSLELKYGGNMKKYAMGGPLEDLGVQEFNVGGSHEENQLGGIPLNNGYSVEEGETRVGNFIFSDRLKINKTLAKEFSLPEKFVGKSFAEASKKMKDKYGFRENDPLTEESIDRELGRLSEAQEAFKEHQKQKDVQKLLTKYPELAQAQQPQQADPMQDMGALPEEAMQGMGEEEMMQMMQGEQPMALGGTMGYRLPSMDIPLSGGTNSLVPVRNNSMMSPLAGNELDFMNLLGIKNNSTIPNAKVNPVLNTNIPKADPNANTKMIASMGEMEGDNATTGGFNKLTAGRAGVGLATGIARLAMNKKPTAISEDRYFEPISASRVDINPQMQEATTAFSGARRAAEETAPNAGNLISNKAMIAAQEAATKAQIAGSEAARFTIAQDEANAKNAIMKANSRQQADQLNTMGAMAYRQNLDTLVGDLGDFGGEVFNQLSAEQKLNLLIEKGMIKGNYDFRN